MRSCQARFRFASGRDRFYDDKQAVLPSRRVYTREKTRLTPVTVH